MRSRKGGGDAPGRSEGGLEDDAVRDPQALPQEQGSTGPGREGHKSQLTKDSVKMNGLKHGLRADHVDPPRREPRGVRTSSGTAWFPKRLAADHPHLGARPWSEPCAPWPTGSSCPLLRPLREGPALRGRRRRGARARDESRRRGRRWPARPPAPRPPVGPGPDSAPTPEGPLIASSASGGALSAAAVESGWTSRGDHHDRLLNLLGHPAGSAPTDLEAARASLVLLRAHDAVAPAPSELAGAAAALRALGRRSVGGASRQEQTKYWGAGGVPQST